MMKYNQKYLIFELMYVLLFNKVSFNKVIVEEIIPR